MCPHSVAAEFLVPIDDVSRRRNRSGSPRKNSRSKMPSVSEFATTMLAMSSPSPSTCRRTVAARCTTVRSRSWRGCGFATPPPAPWWIRPALHVHLRLRLSTRGRRRPRPAPRGTPRLEMHGPDISPQATSSPPFRRRKSARRCCQASSRARPEGRNTFRTRRLFSAAPTRAPSAAHQCPCQRSGARACPSVRRNHASRLAALAQRQFRLRGVRELSHLRDCRCKPSNARQRTSMRRLRLPVRM